jgi:fumarate reductase iron-sulfur subunit
MEEYDAISPLGLGAVEGGIGGAQERLDILSGKGGIWDCTFVGECTRVCPKNVDPAGAIQQYKIKGALHWFKSVLLPWGNK